MFLHELQTYIFEGETDAVADACARWMASSRAFKGFVETHRDKIRKKVRTSRAAEERRDLLAELSVAQALLRERRLTLEYEAYAAEKRRGPDFSLTFRSTVHFNVEVTRLRAGRAEQQLQAPDLVGRLASLLCAKAAQMPPSAVNVLCAALDGVAYRSGAAGETMKRLKQRAEQKEDGFFRRRGFDDARDYLRHAGRLSAVLIEELLEDGSVLPIEIWSNPEARHPLPAPVGRILLIP